MEAFFGIVSSNAVILTIKKTSDTIINELTKIVSNDVTNIKDELKKIDIENKVLRITLFLLELKKHQIEQKCVNLSLISVDDILVLIKNDLISVGKKIEDHKEKYFSKYRKLDCSSLLHNIKFNNNILDRRIDFLFKLLTIKMENHT